MGNLELIQAAQTAALLTVAVAIIYALVLLRRELRQAASVLAEVINGQKQLDQNVRRSWERIDAIEARIGEIIARDGQREPPEPRPPGSSP